MSGDIIERTVASMVAEIERSPWRGRPAKTVFFGGGTPTFLDERSLLSIFEAVIEVHPPISAAEITSEANPGTVDSTKFTAMRRAGFNRISLGAQSFEDSDLISLDRIHKAGDIERAVGAAREAGFDNLNLDLMFALPNQSRHAWERNLDRALKLRPEHMSLYCLTIEPNTAFYKKNLRGQLDLPNDDEQVAMYDASVRRTEDAGYAQYEISNFARPGSECRHNLEYWHGADYAAYGPGAVGCVDGARYTNLKHPVAFCDAVERGLSLPFESEELTPDIVRTEKIMLGIRLNAGISTEGLDLSSAAIARLIKRGWITDTPDTLRLTPAGRHFCSEVSLELI